MFCQFTNYIFPSTGNKNKLAGRNDQTKQGSKVVFDFFFLQEIGMLCPTNPWIFLEDIF
jgi:hypothetical protein